MANLNETRYNPENLELEKKVNSSFPKKEMEKRLTPENVAKQKYKDLLIAEKKESQVLKEQDDLQQKIYDIFTATRNRKKAEEKILKEIAPLMNKAIEKSYLLHDEYNKAYKEWEDAIQEEFEKLGEENEE